MIGLWLGVFFHLFCSSLQAKEADPFESSLSNTQSLLPTIVQSVSAISGEWLDAETDFVIKGTNPLVLSRSFSAGYSSGRLGYNWDFNRPHRLVVQRSKHVLTRFHHPAGIRIVHRGKESDHHPYGLHLYRTSGLTNCYSSEMSGKTNLHNIRIKIDPNKDFAEVICGNGDVTHYVFDQKYYKLMTRLFPKYERKANGNLILFKDEKMVSANGDETLTFGKIYFHSLDQTSLDVKTHHGQKATYTFDSVPYNEGTRRFCLKCATYSHKPQIEYEYDLISVSDDSKIPPNPLLTKKKWPEGRFIEMSYYKPGVNVVDSLSPVKLSEDSMRKYRVKEILQPVGQDQTPIVTHRFLYSVDKHKRGKPFSGTTVVYDAYMHKTVYAYNNEHRPISVSRFRNEKMYSKENFIWDEGERKAYPNLRHKEKMITSLNASKVPGSEILANLLNYYDNDSYQVGNLLGKYQEDENNNIRHGLFFYYDLKGNIRKERFYGHLTGTKEIFIELDKEQKPKKNGIEYYTKNYTYSKNAFNHLLTESEFNGKEIAYNYDKETQQVSAKYIKPVIVT